MPNRTLSQEELEIARRLLALFTTQMQEASGGDSALFWALRRKIAKKLIYAERGGPNERGKLKRQVRLEQGNKCAVCGCELPDRNAVLDRHEAMKGYIHGNVRVLCPACDLSIQQEREFK